jgi:hypothetical protein
MNEVDLIRAQLSAERQHAAEVANACAGALENAAAGSTGSEFCQACVDYLVWVLAQFEVRDQMLAELFHSRLGANDAIRAALDDVIARRGTSREALRKLEAALAVDAARAASARADNSPGKSWQEFAQFFNGVWSARRDALDELFKQHARISDWRAVSLIDADSILEERSRYARVRGKLPAGVELRTPVAPRV